MSKPQIVWLRRDLRIADNPALYHAAQAGPVVAVYVLDDEAAGHHAYGGASRAWLDLALEDFGATLASKHIPLILRRGDAVEHLAGIAEEIGAEAVHANRHYEPWWRKAQGQLAKQVDLELYDANYLLPPGTVTTGSGDPYKIYTPFSKAMLEKLPPRDLVPEPAEQDEISDLPESENLSDWKLSPVDPDWAASIRKFWDMREEAAHERLEWWEDHIDEYDEARNLPSVDKTAQLSPYLHFGQISPVQIWHHFKQKRSDGWRTFEKELIWRDYAQNVIAQFPSYASESYREGWDEDMQWRDPDSDEEARADLTAWQKGQTGYPIVDAGMRQLWQTGWMHNRVRMIAASFLIKHLLIDWRHGEKWFWDTLVDADLASNATNWQWVAGTGVDSNMFSRIMAPLSQSEKFDAAGYIREYVPELAALNEPYIHDPEEHGCLPDDYPPKRIGHKQARERALSTYKAMKS